MPKKKCSACEAAKRRKRKRQNARVGKVSTGAYVAGAVLLLGVGAAVYLKFKDLDKKISIVGVDINGISGGKLQLTVNILNLSSLSVPFSGYNGYVYLNQNIELGQVVIRETATIPAHGEIALPVAVSPNWLALPSIAKDLRAAIEDGDWTNFRLDLNGTVFVGDLSIDIDKRFA